MYVFLNIHVVNRLGVHLPANALVEISLSKFIDQINSPNQSIDEGKRFGHKSFNK